VRERQTNSGMQLQGGEGKGGVGAEQPRHTGCSTAKPAAAAAALQLQAKKQSPLLQA
jgi:hypothetical protein